MSHWLAFFNNDNELCNLIISKTTNKLSSISLDKQIIIISKVFYEHINVLNVEYSFAIFNIAAIKE